MVGAMRRWPLLRNCDYMLLWSGEVLSELGSQTSAVAYPLLILALTGSPAKAGVAAEFATPVTNSVVAGSRVVAAPDHLQGRVQAAATMVTMSLAWLGPLAIGLAFQHTGSTVTILILAGWTLAMATIATLAPALRVVLPGPPDAAAETER